MPIIQRFIVIYKLWHEYRNNFPKGSRYTVGAKIDMLFIETIEFLFIASYLPKETKVPYLRKAAVKLDLLKFFLRVSWEIHVLDNKKYIALSEKLNEIGRMLGGWIKGLESKTPTK